MKTSVLACCCDHNYRWDHDWNHHSDNGEQWSTFQVNDCNHDISGDHGQNSNQAQWYEHGCECDYVYDCKLEGSYSSDHGQ